MNTVMCRYMSRLHIALERGSTLDTYAHIETWIAIIQAYIKLSKGKRKKNTGRLSDTNYHFAVGSVLL